ncbi:hypothetical protein PENTCL1PPCAC_22327, partial [Pristionchus entomophagus]
EAMGYIAQAAGLSIQPVPFNISTARDIGYGSYQNGSWTGALGDLAAGVFDIACLFYQRNEERSRDFHFTSSFQRTQFVMFSRLKTEPMPPTLGSPYEVWLSALATIFVQTIALFIISESCQTSRISNLHWHRRWETFTTIEEAESLIETGELIFVITHDGTFYRQLFASEDPSFVRLRKAFEKGGRRNVTASFNEEAVTILQEPGFLFGTHSESSSFQYFRDVCDIFFLYSGLPTQSTQFITRKDFPFNHRIDNAIIQSDGFLYQ